MMSAAVEQYIALHTTVGYRFREESVLLRLFVRYAEDRGDEIVRAQTVLEWAAKATSPGARRRRLHVVRRFAHRMSAEEVRHEVPPPDVFGPVPPRRPPVLFAPGAISELLTAAAGLGPKGSLRSRTYTTLLGLLACTGLRISEALTLRCSDLTAQGLVIRVTKFKKSRLVPLHETSRQALEKYLTERGRRVGADDALFVSGRGTRLRHSTVNGVFLRLARGIGLHPGAGQRGVRLHDLRHTFAVRSLEQCQGDRHDVARHMLALSTYLGHARLAHTYWYLEATPALLSDIAARSESLATGASR